MTKNTTGKPSAPMQPMHHERRLTWGWWLNARIVRLKTEHSMNTKRDEGRIQESVSTTEENLYHD